jgi:hypothetical protein
MVQISIQPEENSIGSNGSSTNPLIGEFFPFILMETLFAHTLPATLPETSLTLMR